MKQIKFILILLLAVAMQACSEKSVLEKDWLCNISIPQSEKCQSIAVINRGELKLKADGTFQLDAVYEACYEQITASVSGVVAAKIALNKVIEMELIAKAIEQNPTAKKSKKTAHPRTIGFVNLQRETGRGSYSDVWGVIRMKGLYQQPIANRMMRCESIKQ